VARALIGGGVLASMRGNYPEARRLFRRALTAAERSSQAVLRRAVHQGLLVAAIAARDVDTALAHGWAAYLEAPDDAAASAETLVSLADVSLRAGEYRAALGACVRALQLSGLMRVRLPALGTAAIAAANLRDTNLLNTLVSEVERSIGSSGQPFENARALLEVAEACVALKHADTSSFAVRAAALARQGGFHEVSLRADAILAECDHWHSQTREPQLSWQLASERQRAPDAQPSSVLIRRRAPRSRSVLRALAALPTTAARSELVSAR
jgi:tetratricopeptide (TPR) repeat protein